MTLIKVLCDLYHAINRVKTDEILKITVEEVCG